MTGFDSVWLHQIPDNPQYSETTRADDHHPASRDFRRVARTVHEMAACASPFVMRPSIAIPPR